MEQSFSFEFKKIALPKLDCTFLAAPKSHEFSQFIRLEALIVDDFNIRILFGVKLTSNEKIHDQSKVDVLVEMIADFKLSQTIPFCDKLSEVPALANMAAVMFPFIREKIHYCLTSNNFPFLLGSVNVYEMVKQSEGKPGFSISDNRKNKQIELNV